MAARLTANFFENQDQARRKTFRLIVLFIIAVLLIVVAIYFVFRLVLYMGLDNPRQMALFTWWEPVSFAGVAFGVILFIGLASLIKIYKLKSGGGAVAEMLGGRLIPGDTRDQAEKRLLNVVEEMALAAGVPMPQVYVMDRETGINAFAAGFTTSDAAVAVTKGTLEQLNRDELQGVIAHEFSHILNGDMRLNIRLIGVLFGILAIGIIGYYMARFSRFDSKRGVPFALIGFLLMIIGYIGTFIGQLIQSAVSRQKEFLADASSVQFTRNPAGIAGALKKIGGYIKGSRIETPAAGQASHLFFGESRKHSLFSFLLSTHPPLAERIRRIDPSFEYEAAEAKAAKAGLGEQAAPAFSAPGAQGFDAGERAARLSNEAIVDRIQKSRIIKAEPAQVVGRVGNPTAEHLDHGAALAQMVPDAVRQALSTMGGAVWTIYALLLDPDDQERQAQVKALNRTLKEDQTKQVTALYDQVQNISEHLRLPLIDLAMPALRNLGFEDLRRFLETVETLVAADGKVTLFEFTVQWMLNYRLMRARGKSKYIAFKSFGAVQNDVVALLAALAAGGNPGNAEEARRAFNEGVNRVPDLARKPPIFQYQEKIAFGNVGKALTRLALASFEIKQTVIDACAHCAFADKTITVPESELLRVVSTALECPLPPFLPVSD